jgi:RNA polymerase sigma factor (sigma-70 family)
MGENLGIFLLAMSYFESGKGLANVGLDELIVKIGEGEARAEEALLRIILPKITPILRARLGEAYEAWKDVRQECGKQILLSIRAKKFDPQLGKPWPFFLGIVWKLVKSHYRARKQYESRREEQDLTNPELAAALDLSMMEQAGLIVREIDLEADERLECLQHCIEQLPENQRYVVGAKYREGLKHKEIGLRINKTEQQVTELHRLAMSRLRKCIEKFYRS